MPIGITVKNVSPAPMKAPLRAVFGSFAANTLSIKSNAIISPNPNARIPAQLIKAPFAVSNSPERSRNSGGALARIVSNETPENPPAKKIKAAQNEPIARYIWKISVYAEANSPPATVYVKTTNAAIIIANKNGIPKTVCKIKPLAAKFPATSITKLIIIKMPEIPSAPFPYLLK